MKIAFSKYHGTGNDFILIDDRKNELNLSVEQVAFICNRHFGIGGDGLIRITSSDSADFEMVYYNSDGRPGSMCGNGGRCAVTFAHALGMIGKSASFLAFDGMHEAEVISSNPYIIKLRMNDVSGIKLSSDFTLLDTGSPHYVTFVSELESFDVVGKGRAVRYSEPFRTNGVNVNFVKPENGGIAVRTYERGVEDETLSCGTGVTASVLSAILAGKVPADKVCSVMTPGGDLKVHSRKTHEGFTDIYLEGPAAFVFKGEITL